MMGNISFSDKQLQVIRERDKNILVSAAAGSGKTTVLVERIIRRIMDPQNPIDVDRLLVLTYTNSAAAEMKERITDRLYRALEENPEDMRLKNQTVLIHNAQITTIHSFCLSLIKNHFHEAGLEPGFRIADEGEFKFIAGQCLDRVMEDMFDKIDEKSLRNLLNALESKDNMNKFRQTVSTFYEESEKAPFPEEYIEERRRDYMVFDGQPESLDWLKDMLHMAEDITKKAFRLAEENLELSQSIPEYMANASDDMDICRFFSGLGTYGDFNRALKNKIKFSRLSGKKGSDEEDRELFTLRRQQIKDTLKELEDGYFALDEEALKKHLEITGRLINTLADIVLYYRQVIAEEKAKKRIITFSDMEHLALKILLVRDENGNPVHSGIAKEYREYFEEIMVDEYQDSNYIQEAILSSISRQGGNGTNNRFMVGDVKQSIYRFRNANPEIFTGKYREYQPDDRDESHAQNKRIDLSANYRSRREVVDGVNIIFERIMRESRGGIEYDENARLYPGNQSYQDSGYDYTPKLLLLERDKESKLNKEEQEALLIGNQIRELIRDGRVQDKKTGAIRACRYGDIVILLRSMAGMDKALKKILECQGIPVYIASKSGFFDSLEIKRLINFLKVIDNPLDDICLYGTLMVFGTFTESEAALLRVMKNGRLYESIKYAATHSIEEIINDESVKNVFNGEDSVFSEALEGILQGCIRKSVQFWRELGELRELAVYTPVDLLIREICTRYDYINLSAAMPGGEQKRANILMLLEKARHFTENGFKGIYSFNRYIDGLHKYGTTEGDASVLDEKADVVRIMTMHSSKGLEFPVCIVANLSKKKNEMDTRNTMVCHPTRGMGIDFVDVDRRIKYKCPRKKYIVDLIKAENESEELRVLYVALTRAKEKLIMTARIDDGEKLTAPLGSMLSYILEARGEDNWKGCIDMDTCPLPDMEISPENHLDLEEKRQLLMEAAGHAGVSSELLGSLNFTYGHGNLEGLYTKTTVSELKKAAFEESDGQQQGLTKNIYENNDAKEEYIPNFIRDDKDMSTEDKITAGMRGSAYHRILELYDFSNNAPVESQMQDKICEGILTEAEWKMVRKDRIEGFINSPMGERMRRASQKGRLYREQPFVLGIEASRLDKAFPSEEMILVQGIIDAYIEEDGELVLLDYKTDRVDTEKELILRYHVQLDYYGEALERITGMTVKEKLIYSFALKQLISV